MERAKDFFSFSFLKEKVHNLNMQSSTIHINRTLLRSTDGLSGKLKTKLYRTGNGCSLIGGDEPVRSTFEKHGERIPIYFS